MTTLALRLDLPPAELLRRLPRREGTFLLDGGGPDSWGAGEALLGCEASAIVSRPAPGDDPFGVPETLLRGGAHAGVVVALGYDLARDVERLGVGPPHDRALPRLYAAAHPWVLAYSHRQRDYELRSPALSRVALQEVADRLRASAAGTPPVRDRAAAALCPRSTFTREGYVDAVQRVQDYIAAGDVYQVNLAQRFRGALDEPPATLFARLLARHPAPWAGYLDGGAFALVSNSPECFLRRTGDRVATFPIKGTRPRGSDDAADKAMAGALRSSVKDGAEHLMIVDLERNDLGRVCVTGSVAVDALATCVPFDTVQHLISTVRGTLRPGVGIGELLRATFPSGSITGAPKIRAMDVIAELEGTPRGFYTGAIGWIDAGGDCDLNVAIRTAVADGERLVYAAGGGIVADSRVDREHDELHLKATALFRALGVEDPRADRKQTRTAGGHAPR